MANGLRSILDRPTEPAPRPVRRRIGLAILLLILAVTGWAVAKHLMTGGLKSSELAAATRLISEGIATDDTSRFVAAEQHLQDAASVSVLDPYPAFLIVVVRRLQRPEALGDDAPEGIVRAMLDEDWARARKLAAREGSPGTRPRVFWERLLDELAAVQQRRGAQTSSS